MVHFYRMVEHDWIGARIRITRCDECPTLNNLEGSIKAYHEIIQKVRMKQF